MTPRVAVGSRSRGRLAKQTQDLAGSRMSAKLRLLEDGDAVTRHLEPPAARWLHGDRRVGIPLTNRGRQTGGPRFVVSDGAVLDVDRHGGSGCGECRRGQGGYGPSRHRHSAPCAREVACGWAVQVVCHQCVYGRMIPWGFGGSGIP